jgi:uncharacterized protein (DUF736 family)
MPFEKDPNKLGALWIKESARGEYMTGTIDGVKVVVFRNNKKNSDKSPDWRVMKSLPKEERGAVVGHANDDIVF